MEPGPWGWGWGWGERGTRVCTWSALCGPVYCGELRSGVVWVGRGGDGAVVWEVEAAATSTLAT